MKNNLFIVNTPLHLFEAFILIKSKFDSCNNFVLLVHAHGLKKWQESPIMTYLSSIDAGFKQVFSLTDHVSRTQIQYIKKVIKPIGFDEVFTGSDFNVANQLVMAAIGVKKFNRLDDGMGAYYSYPRSTNKEIFHKLQIKLLGMLYGANPKFKINTSGIGRGESCKADYLFNPDLLKRSSPQIVAFQPNMIQLAVDELKNRALLRQELYGNKYALYLSQGAIPLENEISFFQKYIKKMPVGNKLIYKPHPNDKEEKLIYIKQHYPDIIINDSKVPAELLLVKEPLIDTVIGSFTSTLIFSSIIANRKVKGISVAKYFKNSVKNIYVEMMKDAGVEFFEG